MTAPNHPSERPRRRSTSTNGPTAVTSSLSPILLRVPDLVEFSQRHESFIAVKKTNEPDMRERYINGNSAAVHTYPPYSAGGTPETVTADRNQKLSEVAALADATPVAVSSAPSPSWSESARQAVERFWQKLSTSPRHKLGTWAAIAVSIIVCTLVIHSMKEDSFENRMLTATRRGENEAESSAKDRTTFAMHQANRNSIAGSSPPPEHVEELESAHTAKLQPNSLAQGRQSSQMSAEPRFHPTSAAGYEPPSASDGPRGQSSPAMFSPGTASVQGSAYAQSPRLPQVPQIPAHTFPGPLPSAAVEEVGPQHTAELVSRAPQSTPTYFPEEVAKNFGQDRLPPPESMENATTPEGQSSAPRVGGPMLGAPVNQSGQFTARPDPSRQPIDGGTPNAMIPSSTSRMTMAQSSAQRYPQTDPNRYQYTPSWHSELGNAWTNRPAVIADQRGSSMNSVDRWSEESGSAPRTQEGTTGNLRYNPLGGRR